MRRASEASLFFLGFPRKKTPLHNGSYKHRVPKIEKENILLYVCVIRHRNWPLRSTILSAHIPTKPSRACFAVSRLELIEPGAASCV